MGTDPSEYLHAKWDAFCPLRFCRSTPARPLSCCSPPNPHAVPPGTLAWHKSVVTPGKPTFSLASGFSAYTWHIHSVWDQRLEETGTYFSVGTTFIGRDLWVGNTVLKKYRYPGLVVCALLGPRSTFPSGNRALLYQGVIYLVMHPLSPFWNTLPLLPEHRWLGVKFLLIKEKKINTYLFNAVIIWSTIT